MKQQSPRRGPLAASVTARTHGEVAETAEIFWLSSAKDLRVLRALPCDRDVTAVSESLWPRTADASRARPPARRPIDRRRPPIGTRIGVRTPRPRGPGGAAPPDRRRASGA